MVRRALITALVAIPLAAASAVAAGFTAHSENPQTFTAAERFCPLPETVTQPAVADTFVNAALLNTGNNYGSSGVLGVYAGLLGLLSERQTLIKFNLPAIPERCELSGATLRLYNVATTAGRTVNVRLAAASWGEMTATWNNKPGQTGPTSSATTASGWQTWNVLSHVQAQYAGANNGFLLSDPGGLLTLLGGNDYQSRHVTPASQQPQLVLTFD